MQHLEERWYNEEQYRKDVMLNLHEISKGFKSGNFCYRIVGRAITTWVALEKSNIAIAMSEK